MPLIPGQGGKPPRRRPALRGVLLTDISQGKERARSWPTARNAPKTKSEAYLRDKFADAAMACKYMDAKILAMFEDAVRGSPLLPRDLVVKMLYNRLIAITTDDNRTWWPMPAITDVSESLDVLASALGDILIRQADRWRGVQLEALRPSQAWVYRSSNVAIGTGTQTKIPFNTVISDPRGWWNGSPNYDFTVDRDGLYFAELSIRRTATGIAVAAIRNGGTTDALTSGNDIANQRTAACSGFLNLAAGQTITSACTMNSAGTLEGGAPGFGFFRLTGPFIGVS